MNELTTELDELLIPTNGRFKSFPITMLTGGADYAPGNAMSGFGQSPLHYVETRGPEQDGSTPVSLRWDARTMQIALQYTQADRQLYWWARQQLLTLINPTRSFGSTTIAPLIYRKKFPAGRLFRGSDAQAENGSFTVVVPYGRFVDVGGLTAGNGIKIGGVQYHIENVFNDFTIELSTAFAGATGTYSWEYVTSQTHRDLSVLPASGPMFDVSSGNSQMKPFGFSDVIRFTAHDPFWYGAEQSQVWTLPTDFGDLVFDGNGAYFGDVPGVGRWLFAPDSIAETINVVYWGSYRAQPRLVVSGPAESISFQNITTGKSILVEYEIFAGESITIDTLLTTVTKSDGTNLLPFTSGDISFFAIEPENWEHGRINSIFVSFSSATTESRATMYWSNAYTGI